MTPDWLTALAYQHGVELPTDRPVNLRALLARLRRLHRAGSGQRGLKAHGELHGCLGK